MQPLQEIEATEARHLQIEQNHVRERALLTIGVLALTLQISDGLSPITDMLKAEIRWSLLEFMLDEENIIRVVFHQ
jgi:hypothetical protein